MKISENNMWRMMRMDTVISKREKMRKKTIYEIIYNTIWTRREELEWRRRRMKHEEGVNFCIYSFKLVLGVCT